MSLIKIPSRIWLFFRRAWKLSGLGFSARDKALIIWSYFFFSLLRLLGGNYASRAPKFFRLYFRGETTPFYFRGLPDFYMLEGIFLGGEYDIDLPEEPEVIFDLGSNVGVGTLFFKLRYPKARIFAYEPDPNNKDIFEKNMEPFKDSVIFSDSAVVGTPKEKVEFFVSGEPWSSSLFAGKDKTGKKVVCNAVTLDGEIKKHGINRIDILKFDIEGAEEEVFAHFEGLPKVLYAVGELHVDLIKKTVEDFCALFPGFALVYRTAKAKRPTVLLKNTRI